MGQLIRSIVRYVPRWGLEYEPCAQQVEIHLVRYTERFIGIKTPWALLDGAEDTTDAQLIAAVAVSFDNESEALEYAKRRAPYAGTAANEDIRAEVNCERRYSQFGHCKVADKYNVSSDYILAVARGEKKAPKLPKVKA